VLFLFREIEPVQIGPQITLFTNQTKNQH